MWSKILRTSTGLPYPHKYSYRHLIMGFFTTRESTGITSANLPYFDLLVRKWRLMRDFAQMSFLKCNKIPQKCCSIPIKCHRIFLLNTWLFLENATAFLRNAILHSSFLTEHETPPRNDKNRNAIEIILPFLSCTHCTLSQFSLCPSPAPCPTSECPLLPSLPSLTLLDVTNILHLDTLKALCSAIADLLTSGHYLDKLRNVEVSNLK